MKKINFLILSLLVLTILFSCDPGVVNSYYIENRTDYDLDVEASIVSGRRSVNKNDSLIKTVFKSSEIKEIISYGQIGRANDKGSNFLNDVDTINITSTNRKLLINIYDRTNWNIEVNRSIFELDEVKYILVLENKDFR